MIQQSHFWVFEENKNQFKKIYTALLQQYVLYPRHVNN